MQSVPEIQLKRRSLRWFQWDKEHRKCWSNGRREPIADEHVGRSPDKRGRAPPPGPPPLVEGRRLGGRVGGRPGPARGPRGPLGRRPEGS